MSNDPGAKQDDKKRDEVLKRMLNTPKKKPNPKAKPPKKAEGQAGKKPGD